jgi:Rrf2 family protein
MIWVTKKLLFAIDAVLDIAYNAALVPVCSSEITTRQRIPRRYLEPVLQQLVRHGILLGIRGPAGGYRLARERRRIRLGDIVRAVRELDMAADPINGAAGSELSHRVLRPLWLELHDETMGRLDALTLEDLCSRAESVGIEGRAWNGSNGRRFNSSEAVSVIRMPRASCENSPNDGRGDARKG